jgi:hypothetical protein
MGGNVDRMTRTGTAGTYVYCLVASPRRPSLARVPAGLAGLGRVRLLEAGSARRTKYWLVAADAPLARFGEDAINRRLQDLDWVSRAAVAHEAVVEAFVKAPAVLPMKLFTIFLNDARAIEHVAGDRRRIDAVLKRVAGRDEWGVRVMVDRAKAARRSGTNGAGAATGSAYLQRKKAQRDQAAEASGRGRETAAALFERFAKAASSATRRAPADIPATAPLLLDAAYLVPRTRAASFRALVTRESRRLDAEGYQVTLTGPWPAYSFLED